MLDFPDLSYNTFLDIPVEYYDKFDVILIDYDNTLAPWHGEVGDNYLNRLSAIKSKFLVVSNGNPERIAKSFSKTSIEVYGWCLKPLTYRIRRILKKHSVNPSNCIFIGDNLITDIWTGHKLGCFTIKVDPISNKEHPATLFWRLIEYFLTHCP
ncbi:MAG: HAD family hydrolase [Candidatus Cloacimonetes bacterium HGW-Cloacimonetes-3]|jgi:hypothetical protein|nr:MAG: HAD family hydrolase [Candidatus Cloacimonetes bacterium HGW-Cloacimonetes-3]